jgi:hypothetical protein
MRTLLCFLLCQSMFVLADESVDTRVVAERGGVALTIQDVDTAMTAVPVNDRSAVVASGVRLNQILDTELLIRQMAQKGRDSKLAESPEVQRRMARAANEELAKITVEELIQNAEKKDFNLLAKEYYLANPSEFLVPGQTVQLMEFEQIKDDLIVKIEKEYLDGLKSKFFSDLRSESPKFHTDILEVVRTRYGEVPLIGGASTPSEGTH